MKPTIAHLGIAVADLDAALPFYRDVLGVPIRGPEEADGARIVHLEFGESEVELLEPTPPDSRSRRSSRAAAPASTTSATASPISTPPSPPAAHRGYALVDAEPRTGAGGHRIAFLHPKIDAAAP